jgi:hypothetical protein
VSEKPTKIVITGKVVYEDEITIAQAAQIIGFLNAEAGATLPGSGLLGRAGGSRAGASSDAKVASPRAALDASGAKTNPQKIVALAAYVLQDGERHSSWMPSRSTSSALEKQRLRTYLATSVPLLPQAGSPKLIRLASTT